MKLEKNEGIIDRIFRVIFGIAFVVGGPAYFGYPFSYISVFVGLILLITGASGHCSVYSLFGISTCGNPMCDITEKTVPKAKKPAKKAKKKKRKK